MATSKEISTMEGDACKVIRALGFSQDRTHAILNGFTKSLRENGPEWTVSRLKSLRDYFVNNGEVPFPGWVKKRGRRKDGLIHPAGWLGSIAAKNTDRKTVITLLSSIASIVTLSKPTRKQLSKWKEAVINPPRSRDMMLPPVPYFGSGLTLIEQTLERRWRNRTMFAADDIKGTAVPIGYNVLHVQLLGGYPDVGSLELAFEGSVLAAPCDAWDFLTSIQILQGDKPSGVHSDAADQVVRMMRFRAPGSPSGYGMSEDNGVDSFASSLVGFPRRGDVPLAPVGSISFLQQPMGKLRTVANPNRFVQWLNEPLGDALQEAVDKLPGIYVKDQEAGIHRVQEWLKKSVDVTSCDLSSASDTLDYKVATRFIQNAASFRGGQTPYLDESLKYFQKCSEAHWVVTNKKARDYLNGPTIQWRQGQPLGLRPSFPLLTLSNFLCAYKAWHDVDPEGFKAAQAAAMVLPKYYQRTMSDKAPFVIVGDDIVIHTKYATAYASNVESIGGVLNLEKSMRSDHRAEFCGRLIEPDSVIRVKPRWLEANDPQNLLLWQDMDNRKAVVAQMKSWMVKMARHVGAYHLEESGLIPAYRGAPASLDRKNLVHAILSLDNREEAEEAKDVTVMDAYLRGLTGRTHTDRYTLLPLELRAPRTLGGRKDLYTLEQRKAASLEVAKARKLLAVDFDHASDEEIVVRFARLNPKVNLEWAMRRSPFGRGYKPTVHGKARFLRQVAMYQPVRNAVPFIRWPSFRPEAEDDLVERILMLGLDRNLTVQPNTLYDYKTDSRTIPVNPVTALQRLDRRVRQVEDGMIVDGVGAHFIGRMPTRGSYKAPPIRMVERTGDHLLVSYHTDHTDSTPTRVDLPSTKDPVASSRPEKGTGSRTPPEHAGATERALAQVDEWMRRDSDEPDYSY